MLLAQHQHQHWQQLQSKNRRRSNSSSRNPTTHLERELGQRIREAGRRLVSRSSLRNHRQRRGRAWNIPRGNLHARDLASFVFEPLGRRRCHTSSGRAIGLEQALFAKRQRRIAAKTRPRKHHRMRPKGEAEVRGVEDRVEGAIGRCLDAKSLTVLSLFDVQKASSSLSRGPRATALLALIG